MAQTFTMDELMERGKSVYQRNCLACHGASGEGGVGPAIAGSAIAAFGNNMGDMVQPIDVFNYKKG
jgi:cytochrome c oxidase subunit 2